VRVPDGEITERTLALLREAFDAEHERTYGHRGDDQRVEIVHLRLRGSSAQPGRHRDELFAPPAQNGAAGSARNAYFGAGYVETPVMPRSAVSLDPTPGPLIVEDMDA